MIEAPRGAVIRRYEVDPEGAITSANLIVATGHNSLAINQSVQPVSKHCVDASRLNGHAQPRLGRRSHLGSLLELLDTRFRLSTFACQTRKACRSINCSRIDVFPLPGAPTS